MVSGVTGDSGTRQPRLTAQTWGPSSREGIQASCSVVTRVWGTGGLRRVKRRAEIQGLQVWWSGVIHVPGGRERLGTRS